MIHYKKETIQKEYGIKGNVVPCDSELTSFNSDLRITTDRELLQWVMNLADADGNPIECVVECGLTSLRWDTGERSWITIQADGVVNVVKHVKDVKIFLDEMETHNRYGNMGHDSESPTNGDYRENQQQSDSPYTSHRQ